VPIIVAIFLKSFIVALPVALFPFTFFLIRKLRTEVSSSALNALLADTAKFLLFFGFVWAGVLGFG
jgi:hypothetical protein